MRRDHTLEQNETNETPIKENMHSCYNVCMDRKIKNGICHLCGENNKLSLEHVPPQKAFNNYKTKIYGGTQLIGRKGKPWDFSDLKGESHQNGIGWNTLCSKCNNDTGSWYGSNYIDFCVKSFQELEKAKPMLNQAVTIKIKDFYPLRVAKQILVMFCSINSPGVITGKDNLKELLLNKETYGVDIKKYALGIYVNASNLGKYIGLAGLLNLENGESTYLSELSTIPFGYIFQLGQFKQNVYCDISGFLNFDYNDKFPELEITLPVYDSNTPFPGDYRSRGQVIPGEE